jgi:hypothetical protein
MGGNSRSPSELRREIESERERLADAVDSLRAGMNVTGTLRQNLPVIAAGAAVAGFVLAGGIGATMRLVFRRGREGTTKARVGRFKVVDQD